MISSEFIPTQNYIRKEDTDDFEQLYIFKDSNLSFEIISEEPYRNYTRAKCFFTETSGRKHIYMQDPITKGIMHIPFARYVFQVDYWKKYQKWIPEGYEVDHINNDKSDDRLENLQLLTQSQNIRKKHNVSGVKLSVLECPICNILYTIQGNYLSNDKIKVAKCCSLKCGARLRESSLSNEEHLILKNNQIIKFVRTHDFEYEEHYSCFYPYTELSDNYYSVSKNEIYKNILKKLDIDRWYIRNSIEDQIRIIENYLINGHSYLYIANELDVSYKYIRNMIVKYLSKYILKDKYTGRNNSIFELASKGICYKDIAIQLGIDGSHVLRKLKKERPDLLVYRFKKQS